MGCIERISKAYDLLKGYKGNNGYIIDLKNKVYAYKSITLNDFQADFIIENYDFEPRFIGKIVKIADWWGEKKKKELGFEFTPKVMEIGYYMGQADGVYVLYSRFRRSQENGILTFCRKEAILTDFLIGDYHDVNIDFERYDRLASRVDSSRKITEEQKEGVKFLLSRKKCILADDMGFGKMEPLDSLIPTPNGFVMMGDISKGDVVFDKFGNETIVLNTYRHKDKDIYRVTFNDGSSCECGMEHLWEVRREGGEWETMQLCEIDELGIYTDNGDFRFEIPMTKPVQYRSIKYAIEPYAVGKNLSKCFSKSIVHDCDDAFDLSGIEAYKIGSVSQRMDILRGISKDIGHGKLSLVCISKYLADSVSEIVNSLGGTAHTVDLLDCFMIFIELYFSTESNQCRRYINSIVYSRKSDAQCLAVDAETHTYLTGKNYIVTHNTLTLSVAAIEGNFDSVIIMCPASIKTNWKRELSYYVDEKYISIVDGFSDKKKGELEDFLGYGHNKSGKSREELIDEAKSCGKWQDNRFVIVNFDIIDEFYNVGSRVRNLTEDMIERSPMLKYIINRKSLLIIDEAHKLSNKDSIRYKVIQGLIKRGKPDSIYLSTGTPITNNPQNLYNVLKLIGHPITDNYNAYMNRYCNARKICHPKDKAKRNAISNKYISSLGKRNWYELTDKEKSNLQSMIEGRCRMMTIANGESNLDELKEKISSVYLRRVKDDIDGLVKKHIHEMFYDMEPSQKSEYDRLWSEYKEAKKKEDADKEINKDLLEGAVYRKYISNIMVPHTEEIVDKLLKRGEKVVIVCCYDEELYTLKDYYGDKAVIYNGKMGLKQKDAAIEEFYKNPNVTVFIGNIISAGVGINIVNARYMVFNNFDYVPGNNQQMMDRIWRRTQKRECHIIFQIFNDTQYEKIWNTVLKKDFIINQIIKKESDKK